MALKFFPRQSTSLTSFLREYNLSLSYCTHPSLTRALGIFFSTPSYYVFAQQAGLYGDLYSVIVSEVSLAGVCVCVFALLDALKGVLWWVFSGKFHSCCLIKLPTLSLPYLSHCQ